MWLPRLTLWKRHKEEAQQSSPSDMPIDWSNVTFTFNNGQEISDTLNLFDSAETARPPKRPRKADGSTPRRLSEQTAEDEVAIAQRRAQIAEAEAKAAKAKSDNSKRDSMYRWSLGLVTGMLFCTVWFMGWYMHYAMHVKNELPELVLVTWMGTTVVEAIGIVLIIAKYLFPSADSSPEQDA